MYNPDYTECSFLKLEDLQTTYSIDFTQPFNISFLAENTVDYCHDPLGRLTPKNVVDGKFEFFQNVQQCELSPNCRPSGSIGWKTTLKRHCSGTTFGSEYKNLTKAKEACKLHSSCGGIYNMYSLNTSYWLCKRVYYQGEPWDKSYSSRVIEMTIDNIPVQNMLCTCTVKFPGLTLTELSNGKLLRSRFCTPYFGLLYSYGTSYYSCLFYTSPSPRDT